MFVCVYCFLFVVLWIVYVSYDADKYKIVIFPVSFSVDLGSRSSVGRS
jgi:hypothetical protein